MRRIFAGFFLGFFVACAATGAAAQSYPTRPVRVLVGFPPGGGTDIMARLLSPKLSEYLGQQFVVENRPGATTNIASDMVAKSPPDGQTLLFTTSALAINMSLYKNLTFDAVRDFAPISVFAESPNLLVAHTSAGGNVAELLAQARARPGAMNYSSAGAGTSQHLAGELFKARTGVQIVHIPYKGTAASLTAVVAGEVHFSFANVPAILGHVKSGRIRALARAEAEAGRAGHRPGGQHAGGIRQAPQGRSRALGGGGEDFRCQSRITWQGTSSASPAGAASATSKRLMRRAAAKRNARRSPRRCGS